MSIRDENSEAINFFVSPQDLLRYFTYLFNTELI